MVDWTWNAEILRSDIILLFVRQKEDNIEMGWMYVGSSRGGQFRLFCESVVFSAMRKLYTISITLASNAQ